MRNYECDRHLVGCVADKQTHRSVGHPHEYLIESISCLITVYPPNWGDFKMNQSLDESRYDS
jgi:hypothetical protein